MVPPGMISATDWQDPDPVLYFLVTRQVSLGELFPWDRHFFLKFLSFFAMKFFKLSHTLRKIPLFREAPCTVEFFI